MHQMAAVFTWMTPIIVLLIVVLSLIASLIAAAAFKLMDPMSISPIARLGTIHRLVHEVPVVAAGSAVTIQL